MNYPKTFLFLIIFILKVIFSTQSTSSSLDHITSCLKDWLNKISENNEEFKRKIDEAVRKAFRSAEHHRVNEIEYNVTDDLADTFKSKIIFHDINFYTHRVDALSTTRFSLLTPKQKLSGNKISVSTRTLRITLEVDLRKERAEPYCSLFTTLHLNEFVLNATRKSIKFDGVTFSFNMSYKYYYVYNHGYSEDIRWYGIVSKESDSSSDNDTSNGSDTSDNEDTSDESDPSDSDEDSNESNSGSDSDDTSDESSSSREKTIEKFTTAITPMLPKLLLEHINRNPEFSKAFDEITKIGHQKPPNFIFLYPRLKNHREVIPQIQFYGFRLRNVVIMGLQNIESIDINENSAIFTRTLWVKNIRGSLTLDYGCAKETPLEFNYQISYILVSFEENTDLVYAEARGYKVTPTYGNSLTDLQSAVIMEKIESAVASVLMPTKKFWKPSSFESKINIIQNTSTFDWKTIRESYQNLIPFNKDINLVPKKP